MIAALPPAVLASPGIGAIAPSRAARRPVLADHLHSPAAGAGGAFAPRVGDRVQLLLHGRRHVKEGCHGLFKTMPCKTTSALDNFACWLCAAAKATR